MGKMQRDKGARNERLLVEACRQAGLEAERIPLSGAMKGSFAGDVTVAGYLCEVKVRGDGFKQLYGWLAHDAADILAVRADHKPWLVVMPFEHFAKLVKDAMKER